MAEHQDKQPSSEDMSILWTPFHIGAHRLGNRLIALPIFTGYALPDGRVSSLLIEHYARLGRSGVSVVVVANAAVTADGVTSRYNLRADRDEFIPGLTRLARAIRRGGALACLQLNHAGRLAKTEKPLLPSPPDVSNLTFDVASLRDLMNFFPFEKRFGLTKTMLRRIVTWRRGMTDEDRQRVIAGFGSAARRAHEAGFDMVELHGATGYLLTQFLSAYTHRTPSGSGMAFEERIAFPLAVLRAVRQHLPPGFPVGFRLLLREWVPEGITLTEALAWARSLEKEGIAYLSATAGTYSSMFAAEVRKETARAGYLRKDAAALTRAARVPIVISGRIIKPALAARLIREGAADLIGLGRPLLADANWVRKAEKGGKIRACINCYGCLKQVAMDRGIHCVRWPAWISERIELEHKLLSRDIYKGLWVILNGDDLEQLQASLPAFIPARHGLSDTLLFLRTGPDNTRLKITEEAFLDWAKAMWDQRRFKAEALRHIVRQADKDIEQTVNAEIEKGGYGAIFMGRVPDEPWRERLIYRQQGKIIGLIGTHPRQTRVLVATDLSGASLLMLRYICHFLGNKPAFDLCFLHMLTGTEEKALHRWEKMKKILGWDDSFRLRLLVSTGDVARDILEETRIGEYGTVIMSKRGGTGIKRWLIGSVSARVMHGLENQTLFLID